MDLRQLRYFCYVAEIKSFTRAAVQLRVAQPALSRSIAQLEAELGLPIFDRHGRGVTLTDAGALLYEKAEGLLRDLRQIEHDVRAYAAVPSGHVTIAMPTATGQILAPPLMERFRARYPKVSINILEGFSGYMREWVLTGRVDIAIMHNVRGDRELNFHHLMVEHMFVVESARDSAGALREPVASYAVEDLAAMDLILPSRPHSLRGLIEHAAAEHGIHLTLAYEVDGLPIIKSMVERGLGATVLSYVAVTNEVANGSIRAIPLRDPGIHWSLDIASRSDRRLSRAAEALLLMTDEVVRELVQSGVWQGLPDV